MPFAAQEPQTAPGLLQREAPGQCKKAPASKRARRVSFAHNATRSGIANWIETLRGRNDVSRWFRPGSSIVKHVPPSNNPFSLACASDPARRKPARGIMLDAPHAMRSRKVLGSSRPPPRAFAPERPFRPPCPPEEPSRCRSHPASRPAPYSSRNAGSPKRST
jgi:hypothetical protein